MIIAHKKGILFTLTAPSGTGKNTVAKAVLAKDGNVRITVTATTRSPRENEVEGEDYFFLTEEQFLAKREEGEVLEWSHHYNNYYGTLKNEAEKLMNEGYDQLSDINWVGVRALKESIPNDVVSIALLPPSIEAINARLANRQKTSKESGGALELRMEKIREDMKHWEDDGYIFTNDDMIGSRLMDYDYAVVNEDIDKAAEEIVDIINKERMKRL